LWLKHKSNRSVAAPGNTTSPYCRAVSNHFPNRFDFQLNPYDKDSTNLTINKYLTLRTILIILLTLLLNPFSTLAIGKNYELPFSTSGNLCGNSIPDKLYSAQESDKKVLYRYFTKSYDANKGQVDLVFSLPWINNFYMQPINESIKTNSGFVGISAGIDFFYKNNRYVNLSFSAISDFFFPFPAAIDLSGEYELMSSLCYSLTNNHIKNRFSFGYGIVYSSNTWDFRYYDTFNPPPPSREPIKKTNHYMGMVVKGHFQFSKFLYTGLIYRPSILRLNETTIKYEHSISLEMLFKIRIKK
jgi:hypothetical protein